MKDIFEKFLNNCSEKNKNLIDFYIEKRQLEKKYSVGSPDLSHTEIENNFNINFTKGKIEFEIVLPFKKESDFFFKLSKNLNFIDSKEVYSLTFLIKHTDLKKKYTYKTVYDYNKAEGLKSPVIFNYKQDIQSCIDLSKHDIVNFIVKNYCNPENLKEFSGILYDIHISNDPLFDCIHASACLLDKKNSLQLKIK